MKTLLNAALLTAAACCLSAASLVSDGIIGNSGTENRPVRLGRMMERGARGSARQSNPVYDEKTGILYMIVNDGVLNAYTLDGHLAASYPVPKCHHLGYQSASKCLVKCGDSIYFLRREILYSLKLNAPDGTAAVKTSFKPLETWKDWQIGGRAVMSCNSKDGKLAVYVNNHIYLYDTVSGKTEDVYTGVLLAKGSIQYMGWGQDGVFYFTNGILFYKMENWKMVNNKEWPCKYIGRTNAVGAGKFYKNYFYGTTGHSTIYRFSADRLRPDPGVIYGGGSGFFIGSVFEDQDISNPAGIEVISDKLFAVSGNSTATINILKWNNTTKKLERMRRIGSLPNVHNLVLDSKGNIGAANYVTRWNADNDTPIDNTFGGSLLQTGVAESDPDIFVTIGETHGSNLIITAGSLTKVRGTLRDKKKKLPFRDIAGTAGVKAGKKLTSRIFVLSEKGKLYCFDMPWYDNRQVKVIEQPDVKFNFAQSVKKFTGIVSLNNHTLLALGDGQVIVLNPDGENWKEVSRWSRTFEPASRIAARDGKVVISEEKKDKVSVFDNEGKLIAETTISVPGLVAVNGNKILVHEIKNERLRKLLLEDK